MFKSLLFDLAYRSFKILALFLQVKKRVLNICKLKFFGEVLLLSGNNDTFSQFLTVSCIHPLILMLPISF